MSDEPVAVDRLAKIYKKMDAARTKLQKEFDAADAVIAGQMDVIKQQLLDTCTSLGVSSLKTESGTVTRSVKTRYWTGDWSSMHGFLKEHDALDLLERRISQLKMKAFLEEYPDLHPPGLNADSYYSLTITKNKS